MKIDLILKILDKGSPGQIKALFLFGENDDSDLIIKKFKIFSRYFYPKFFDSPDAEFHKEMDIFNVRLYVGEIDSFLNIAFRNSAKTTRTKMFIAFVIANDITHRKKYIKILCRDNSNSTQFVTDIYNLLIQPRVRAFYPEIFAKSSLKREETMSSFTTNSGIKLTAGTVGAQQRGDIQEESRPDIVILDDFEDRLSLMSAQITFKIWENIEEARTGLSKNGGIMFLANYISERGNVHKLVQKIKNQLIVPLEVNGEPTWPPRYTKDDILKIKKEAEDYEGEYQCKPSASKDVYFDRESLEKQIPKQPIEEIAGLKIFRKYDPSHRIGSGHDVAGGVGLDSSTSAFLDFDCYPVQVMATYKNNEIKPDAFAYEIARQGKRFGENLVAVEKNYGSTIDILKTIYPTDKIFKTERTPTIVFQAPKEYGWETNAATKPKMLSEFSQAIEKGIIELNDVDLIAEAKSYTLNDLMDREIDPRLTTRHFDLLVAAAIAWQINKNVKAIPQKVPYDPWAARAEEQKKKNPAR